LPSSFDLKRKQGFSIPLGAWLKQGPWRDFFYDNLKSSKIYNHRRIEELLDSQDKGRNNSERLFGLLMFQLWSEEYNIKIG
jgi:asparagine synthase (glutamine-hydrolysing)